MKDQVFYTEHELRIDWSELDYFRHVNNVSIFKYIQSARVNYWDQIGLTQFHISTNTGPMLASTHCDFLLPLFYPGKIKVFTRTEFIKNTSFGFDHKILNEAGEIAARAKDVMVMFDFNKNEKITFPSRFREAIERLEERRL
ncbi:MAG TPA: acyl-CoA thioesterase [Bacteroidia bacterium]|nr:acyl-CoA thioesterase [Bacteroidia bacterium]